MDIQYSTEGMIINGQLISWVCIDAERNKIRFTNNVLVRIYWDCKREGSLEEKFIIDKDEWVQLRERFRDKQLNFYEPFGKHSAAYGKVTDDDITVSDDFDEIMEFYNQNGMRTGDSFLDALYEAENE